MSRRRAGPRTSGGRGRRDEADRSPQDLADISRLLRHSPAASDRHTLVEHVLAPGAVLRAQAAVGNQAVNRLLRRSPTPGAPERPVMRQPADAGGCVTRDPPPAPEQELPAHDPSLLEGREPRRAVLAYIRHRDQGQQGTLGITLWPAITDYTVPGVGFIPVRGADGRWSARVTRTWLPGTPYIEAFSPHPGLHEIPSATPRFVYLGKEAADRVDEGEREHVADILYAWSAVTSMLDRAVSRVMELRPPEAPTQEQAVECSTAWLRKALPPRLRWPLGRSVTMGMIQAMTSLGTTTWRRDDAWHHLRARAMSPADKRSRGIPADAAAREVVDEGHEIGNHPTRDVIAAKWETLPALD